MDLVILEDIFDGSNKPRDIKFSTLETITENFSKDRIIGEGGSATVYKGVLRNGEVALKRIRNNHTIDESVFRREVNSLLNVSHKNIVRFLGFCSHTEHKVFENEGSRDYIYAEDRERILCFEYINNGSLDKYIADELRGLPWDTRVLIIKGICDGLQYLHIEKQIIHRDLKPANILIDNNMVAKITDFGLSEWEETQTNTTSRFLSPGYAPPEYKDKGEISVKYDVYSLGIIIIELVTGHRSIPNSNNVIRRWRHRWEKSGKKTPFRYQQIAKLIEIGLLCQKEDPYKRPVISDIIRVINELDSTDSQIGNADKSTIGQTSPYSEDDMLGIEPLELCFTLGLSSTISCSLELTNNTNYFIAFRIKHTTPLPYCIQPDKDTVAPRSRYSVKITLQALAYAPQDRKYTGVFIVQSTKVNESLISEDITEDVFNREEGKVNDEVNLNVIYKAEVPRISNVPPTEEESKEIVNLLKASTLGTPWEQTQMYKSTAAVTEVPRITLAAGSVLNLRICIFQFLSLEDHRVRKIDLCLFFQGLAEASSIHATDPMVMTFQELHRITDGFSEKRFLGSGGFGTVYKGIFDNGEVIAVKTLHDKPELVEDQFKNELINLMTVKHENIIRLVGFCSEAKLIGVEHEGRKELIYGEQRALCLEYLQGGNLEELLSDKSCDLDWDERYRIIRGICLGLKHLHTGSNVPIYHLDLKPANILLDSNRIPKIGDFGLSRLRESMETFVTNTYSGTDLYMPPEYKHRQQISSKFDVFSLGIIMIEIIAGPDGYYNYKCLMSPEEFIDHVTENWSKRVQAKPISPEELLEIQTCIKLALRCVKGKQAKRPSITEIVEELNMVSKCTPFDADAGEESS